VISESRHGELQPHQTLQLALIGRFYERIGDHAENMGERIRYIVDGWTPERAGADRARARAENAADGLPSSSRGLAVIDSVSEARRIDATRRDFVANVSHELKTPIGAIALLAETLADADEGDDRERLTRHLNREVKRVESIIDDLLELTRLEEFDSDVARLAVDDVVHEAVDVARGLADARGIEIAVVGAPSGAEIDGEKRQLVRALVNLIDNAVRYSDPESRVTVAIDPLPAAVDIQVSDAGRGIARPELERIFERFYRVDRARSRETGGTGLGLSIVRHVADNHGGRVLVESKLGDGSTFTLQLPRVSEAPTE
jgi:two-component system sensor histidine kinase SenX3